MDLNVGDGRVPEGVYGRLTVTGNAGLDDGVVFDALDVAEGTLDAPRIEGGRLTLDGGTVRCHGDMVVGRVRGHGRMVVDGGIDCDGMDLVGSVECLGVIRCAGAMRVNGRLTDASSITAQSTEVNGVLRGRTLDSRVFELRPLPSRLLFRLGAGDYAATSMLTRLAARRIDAEGLVCGHLAARIISLREGCRVERIDCSESLGMDWSSSATVICGAGRRVRLRA